MRARRPGIGVWSKVTRCTSEQNHVELSWDRDPLGTLWGWSSTEPATGSQLQWGLELLSRHSRTGRVAAALSAWQGPVN